jgi:predicted transcriptional regulator
MEKNPAQDALRRAITVHSKNLGMSQTELAQAARISQPMISRFVAGSRSLSHTSVDRLQRALRRIVDGRIAAVNVVLNERADAAVGGNGHDWAA